MRLMFRVAVLLLTLTACVGCDQLSKSAARSYLPRTTVVSLMGDTVRLQYAENPGAFLSLGAAHPNTGYGRGLDSAVVIRSTHGARQAAASNGSAKY